MEKSLNEKKKEEILDNIYRTKIDLMNSCVDVVVILILLFYRV